MEVSGASGGESEEGVSQLSGQSRERKTYMIHILQKKRRWVWYSCKEYECEHYATVLL